MAWRLTVSFFFTRLFAPAQVEPPETLLTGPPRHQGRSRCLFGGRRPHLLKRLARGGGAAASARSSLSGGASPSQLDWPGKTEPRRRDSAKPGGRLPGQRVCSANLIGTTASPHSMPAAGLTSLPRPTWLGRRLRPPRLPRPLPRRPAPTGGLSGRLPLSARASCRPPHLPRSRRPPLLSFATLSAGRPSHIDSALLQFQPESPVRLPPGLLLANLRRARKGAGAGPSGVTAECCRVVLDDERTSQQFVKAAQALAQVRATLCCTFRSSREAAISVRAPRGDWSSLESRAPAGATPFVCKKPDLLQALALHELTLVTRAGDSGLEP